MYNLLAAVKPIGCSLILTLVILLASYLIEKITGLKLFFWQYHWKKSLNNVRIISNRDSAYFLILNIIVFIYYVYKDKIEFGLIIFLLWLLVLSVLTRLLYNVHRKYQKKDPNKKDNEYF